MKTGERLMQSLKRIPPKLRRPREPIIPPRVSDGARLAFKVACAGLAACGLFTAARGWARKGPQPPKMNEENKPKTKGEGASPRGTGQQRAVPAGG